MSAQQLDVGERALVGVPPVDVVGVVGRVGDPPDAGAAAAAAAVQVPAADAQGGQVCRGAAPPGVGG